MPGLDTYPRALYCGPDAPEADRCADWRVRPAPAHRVTAFACEGARTVDGQVTLCDHDCHGLPDKPTAGPRGGW